MTLLETAREEYRILKLHDGKLLKLTIGTLTLPVQTMVSSTVFQVKKSQQTPYQRSQANTEIIVRNYAVWLGECVAKKIGIQGDGKRSLMDGSIALSLQSPKGHFKVKKEIRDHVMSILGMVGIELVTRKVFLPSLHSPKEGLNRSMLILDLSHLNKFIQARKFRMTSLFHTHFHLWPGTWMVSLDLQDTYWQKIQKASCFPDRRGGFSIHNSHLQSQHCPLAAVQ